MAASQQHQQQQSRLRKALTGEEVLRLAGGDRVAKVITYDMLQRYRSIEQLFGTRRAVLLLYVHSDPERDDSTFGHWTSLCRQSQNTILYTDSYGRKVDDTLTDYTDSHREATDQDNPKLTKLLRDWAAKDPKNRRVVYNNISFQTPKDMSVATCGRWAAYRCRWTHVDEDTYEATIKAAARKLRLSPDELIVKATDRFLTS